MAADGSVLIEFNANASPAEKELAKLKRKIQEAEDAAYQDTAKRDSLQAQTAQAAANLDEAKRTLYEMKSASKGAFSSEEIADQRERVRGLQTEYNQIAGSVERLDQRIATSTEDVARMRDRAGELQGEIERSNFATARMGEAMRHAGENLDKFTSRIKRLAQRVFVFTLITTALRGVRTWMGNVLKSNEQAQASIAKLKAALLTLVQPLVEVIIPAVVKLTNLLARLATVAARVMSQIFGTTLARSAKNAQALNDEANALDEVGEAAEDAAGSLAGFDEINTIGTENKSAGAGGSTVEANPPDFESIINAPLDTILEFFSGAALLALGAILTFSGANILLGLGLMAAGAAFIYDAATTNWGAITQALQGPLGLVMALVGGALFAIGAVLLFSGAHIPLGLALVAAGAAAFATPLAANWGAISTALQGPLGIIAALIGTAFLVLGAVLAFSGASLPIGLGLIAVGAEALGATVAVNWDTVTTALEGPIGAIVALVSTALLALGAILTFTGGNLPLGIGLMIAGAAGLAAEAAINWNSIQEALSGPVGAIVALLSGALIVIGAVLLFSGGSIPLGIGLIAAGALGLATVKNPNWETIQSALRGPVGAISALISGALLVLGAVLLFTGASVPLGLGMLVAGGATLAATVAANWSSIVDALRGPVGAITAILGGSLLVLGAILLFTGAGIPLGLGLILAGAAGLAAAVAPNWSALVQKLKKIGDDIKKYVIDPVVKVFTGFYNTVVGIVEGIVNGFIGVINAFIKGINKVIGTINEIPGVSLKKISTISTVSIPRLAQGAVIPPNREFMAVLGDQKSGTNVEAPLETIKQALVEALREYGGGGDINITLELDGTVLARKVVKRVNDMTRQAGKPVLLY